jgi:DNA-binding transcriptional LysR family regulator
MLMIDPRRARVLCAIADHGSFSEAADALGYTQSAVSHQIATFERELGLTLIERGARPVRLTEAGAVVVEQGRTAAAALELAGRRLADLSGLRTGRLVIGAYPSASATLVPRAIARLRSTHPEIDVAIVQAEPSDLITPLRRGELDIAVVYTTRDEPHPFTPPIELQRLCDDPFVILAPRDHPIARRSSVSMSALANEGWVAPSPTLRPQFRQVFDGACTDSGFDPVVAIEADDPVTAVALVGAGLGLVLGTRLLAETPGPEVAVIPLRGAPAARAVWAATVSGRHVPAGRAALDALKATA